MITEALNSHYNQQHKHKKTNHRVRRAAINYNKCITVQSVSTGDYIQIRKHLVFQSYLLQRAHEV